MLRSCLIKRRPAVHACQVTLLGVPHCHASTWESFPPAIHNAFLTDLSSSNNAHKTTVSLRNLETSCLPSVELLLRGCVWRHGGHKGMLIKRIDGSHTGKRKSHQSVVVKPPRCACRQYKRICFQIVTEMQSDTSLLYHFAHPRSAIRHTTETC